MRSREVIRAFEALGWVEVRQAGGHIILAKTASRRPLSVPNHPGVAKGTLRGLIRSARVTPDEFPEAAE